MPNRLSIRVSDDLYARLSERARRRGESLSSLARQILNIALTHGEGTTDTEFRARLLAQARAMEPWRHALPRGDSHD